MKFQKRESCDKTLRLDSVVLTAALWNGSEAFMSCVTIYVLFLMYSYSVCRISLKSYFHFSVIAVPKLRLFETINTLS